MSKKSPPPKTPAEVARRAKIGAGTSAFWASPEGQELKAKMAKERRGKQTETHKRAMASPEVRQRIADGYRRMLGVVPIEEEPDGPGVVTAEEQAVADREGEADG